VFLDESGFMLQPLRRRTWAPCGVTPIQNAWDRHDRWSVIGALSLAPWALRIGVYFRLVDHNIVTHDVVEFVKQLHRQLGRKVILIWDRWNVHRSAARRLDRYRWLQIEWLPSYAPELNPVEAMWNHTKYTDLANFIPDDHSHLQQTIQASLGNQRHEPYLKHSFFRYADLIV
jgi:transposase